MWKALVRPRGQAPAELYLSSSEAGGVGPPQLEATVEETGSGADAQSYPPFLLTPFRGLLSLGPVCLLCMGVVPQRVCPPAWDPPHAHFLCLPSFLSSSALSHPHVGSQLLRREGPRDLPPRNNHPFLWVVSDT